MSGNTAAYMQNSVARVNSIFGKGNVSVDDLRSADRAAEARRAGRAGSRASSCYGSARRSTASPPSTNRTT